MSLYFVRHGQTPNNINGIMNSGDDDDQLTELGQQQAQAAGISMKKSGARIDIIISSSLSRAKNTAEIIAKVIGYQGLILQDTRLREQDGGVFKGKKRTEIQEQFGTTDDYQLRKIFKNGQHNKVEDILDFDARVGEFLLDMHANYPDSNILLVAHSGTSRALLHHEQGLDFEYTHFEMPGVNNAQVIDLNTYSPKSIDGK